MSFTLDSVSEEDYNLDAVATLIFSEHGRAADKKIDLNGMRVYLNTTATEDEVKSTSGKNLSLRNACKLEEALEERKELREEEKEKERKREKEEKDGEKNKESRSKSRLVETLTVETKEPTDASSSPILGKEIKLEHGHCFPMPICRKTKPTEKKFRQVYYISGPCDCGKSTWIAKMLRLWLDERHKLKQGTDIYLFSKVIGDNAFAGLPVTQIELNSRLLENPFDTSTELHDCMVIFDDIDSIMDKDMKEYLWKLRDELLTVNSHHGTYIMNTSHQLRNWKSTRSSMTEAHTITIFPMSERPKLTEFLDKNIGLEREHRDWIMSNAAFSSRWVTLSPRYPYYAIYEKGAKVLLPTKGAVSAP